MNIFVQAYNTKFSQCQYSQNPNQNSSNNITIYLHCQNSISHQHCPNCTMIKEKITLQECSKANIFKHGQSCNAPKFQNNQMTISHHETFNETCNNIFSKQRNQRKTHPGIYMTIWSMGPRVLKKSIIIIPLNCWIIFLTTKRKKWRSLGGRSHFDAKKMGFTKNGCVMKMLKTQGFKEILIEMDECSQKIICKHTKS